MSDHPPAPNTPVVTGVGIISPLGCDFASHAHALAHGTNGVTSLDYGTGPAEHVRVAGQVDAPRDRLTPQWVREHSGDFFSAPERSQSLSKCKLLRARPFGFALSALGQALSMSGLGADDALSSLTRPLWLAPSLGSDALFLEDFSGAYGPDYLDWLTLAIGHPDEVLMSLSPDEQVHAMMRQLNLGCRYQCAALSDGATSSAASLVYAASLIRRGLADVVICGGADAPLSPFCLGGINSLITTSFESTPNASRPFDETTQGIVLGEGAAMYVFESLGHAQARGAAPLARVTGWGEFGDGYTITVPRPDASSLAKAMKLALRRANAYPAQVNYISALASGDPLQDSAEVAAIRDVFEDQTAHLRISSCKSAMGHTMSAAGAFDVANALSAITTQTASPNLNLSQVSPACDIDGIMGAEPEPFDITCALVNCINLSGGNVSLVVESMPA